MLRQILSCDRCDAEQKKPSVFNCVRLMHQDEQYDLHLCSACASELRRFFVAAYKRDNE